MGLLLLHSGIPLQGMSDGHNIYQEIFDVSKWKISKRDWSLVVLGEAPIVNRTQITHSHGRWGRGVCLSL